MFYKTRANTQPALLVQTGLQRWSLGHKARGQGQGHKKIRGQGQGQAFREQTLSRPRTGMLEAKAKDQGHKHKCSPKKRSSQKFFWRSPKKRSSQNFSSDLHKKTFPKNFSTAPRNFNNSKNSAVLEPRTGQFSRTRGQGLDLRGQGQGFQNVSSRPRTSSRTPPLPVCTWCKMLMMKTLTEFTKFNGS